MARGYSSRGGVRYAARVIFSILLLQTATASRWYYPDETDHREVVDEKFELTGAVLVGVSSPETLPAHPAVATVTW
ncbi:MAG: hypothetical protein ACI8S6_003700, partial [Myxococcota bacterium]